MKRTFALLVILTTPTLLAQEQAPQNDSIRQSDLRADLFFLASDAMQGRLAVTSENRLEVLQKKRLLSSLNLGSSGWD